MATYAELFDLKSNGPLKNKISVSVVIKAQAYIALSTPTQNQLAWASKALNDPNQEADKLMNYVLAANKSASTATILAASDATVQGQVDAAVDKLVDGGVI